MTLNLNEEGYPVCPKVNSAFKRHWNNLIKDVYDRENFKESHIQNLRILCDLYCEYELLRDIVTEKGYSYEAISDRGGYSLRERPEVKQMNTCVKDIASYSKLLGIVLVKDSKIKPGNQDGELWE